MSNMEIEVSFLAGTTIFDAVTEAKEKAVTLEVAYITFDFNGVSMNIRADTNVARAVEAFKTQLADEIKRSRRVNG